MVNANAAGLGLSTLVGALVHGNAADIATVETAHKSTGLKVGGEVFENIIADTVAKGYKGLPFVREILRRTNGWGKYGLEALSISVAPLLAKQIGNFAGKFGLDAKTRGYIELGFIDLAEGVSRGAIAASDPNREVKIDALVEQVKKRFENAFRDHLGVIHLARLADDGTVLEDSATPPRPLACVHWQQMTAGWDAQHPDIIVRGNNGGNNNQNQNQGRGRDIPGLKIPYERGGYDAFVIGSATPHLCPVCFAIAGAAAKPAEKAAAWWPRVDGNAAVKRVLLAVTHKVGKATDKKFVMVDLLEDLEKACSFEAIKIACEDIEPRLVEVQQFRKETDAAGVVTEVPAGSYDEISDADMEHFRVWIDGLGGAELTVANKAKVAGLDLKERFDDAMKSMGIWAWVVLAFAASLVFGYAIVWPVVTLAIWAVGVFFPGDLLRFGDTDYGPALNVACMLVSSMSLIVWVSFWKTAEGTKKMFGGLIQHGSDLANLARNFTALFLGASLVALLELIVGAALSTDTTALRMYSVPGVMLSAIVVDQTAAAWSVSKTITDWREKYALRTLVSASAIGLVILVVGAIALAKIWYVGPEKTEAEKAQDKAAQVEVAMKTIDAAEAGAKARIAEAEAVKAEADAHRAAEARHAAEATAKAVSETDAPRAASKPEVAKAETSEEKCARIAHYSYATRRSAGCVK